MTATIVGIQRSIRRALQKPINDAAAAFSEGPVAIQWKGIPFDRVGRTRFLAVEIGMGPVVIHEVGPNPMVEGSGHVTIVIRTHLEKGEDANDALLSIVTAAYPYNSHPTYGAVSVNIDKMEHRGYGIDGPWMTGVCVVHWNIYRRN